jgi:hypothetical protein
MNGAPTDRSLPRGTDSASNMKLLTESGEKFSTVSLSTQSGTSAPVELRSALLGKRARAFLGAVVQEHRDAELGVDLERLVLVHALGFPDRADHRLHGDHHAGADPQGNTAHGDVLGARRRRSAPDRLQRLAGLPIPARACGRGLDVDWLTAADRAAYRIARNCVLFGSKVTMCLCVRSVT